MKNNDFMEIPKLMESWIFMMIYEIHDEIHDHFKKRVDAVVDGGSIFAEHSTIIDFSQGDPILLRQGKGNSSWLE